MNQFIPGTSRLITFWFPMPVTLPEVPPPPPPQVQRFDAEGKPTEAQVIYEIKRKKFEEAVKAAIEALP